MPAPAPIVYVEIPAPDLAASRAFFEEVFAWSIRKGMGDRYLEFEAGPLQGGLDAEASPTQSGVLLYVKVDDLEATLASVERAGGRTVRPRWPVGGDHGYFALFADPAGNRLGLWSPS